MKSVRPVLVDAGTQTDYNQFMSHQLQNDNTLSTDTALANSIKSCIEALLMPVSTHVHGLQNEVEEMKTAIAQLTSIVSSLNENCSDIGSLLAADDEQEHEAEAEFVPATSATHRSRIQSRRQAKNQNGTNTSQTRHTEQLRHLDEHPELKRDVVASVYADIELKHRRSRNIILSGIPYSSDDFGYVTNLLAEEFSLHYIPTVSCRRVGKKIDGRVQLLLVNLESKEDADYFIVNARSLRASCDRFVRDSIYISVDLTPAEAKAAYDIRCRRREMNERNQRASNRTSWGEVNCSKPPSSKVNGAAVDGLRPTSEGRH